MHYVYLLRSNKNKLYYGLTSDLRRRLNEHNSGKTISTAGQQWYVIYYEAYLDRRDARARELSLKQYGQALGHLKRRLSFTLGKS